MVRIYVTSIPVQNQDKALKFYTEKLGFIKKTDVPVSEYKWLTVVSPKEQNGVELLLIGDLSNIDETKEIADAVNKSGAFDAVVHNAGVYQVPASQIFAVNTLALIFLRR